MITHGNEIELFAGNSNKPLAEAIAKEADIWSSLFATQDQKEGMRAFVDKRKPQYIGK